MILSLKDRRKQQLGSLQQSIKILSVVDGQRKRRHTSHQIHLHSANNIPNSPSDLHENKNNHRNIDVKNISESEISFPSSEDDVNLHHHSRTFDDKYQIMDKIGEGAHGVVSKCFNRKNNKVWAVKTLRWQDEHFRSLKTNFINIKQLKHKGLIKNKAIYLNHKMRVCHTVLEYFPHPSLKPTKVTEDELRTICYQLFEAVSYLHCHHICHRDIKPDNILYDKVQKNIKVIDFGVSKNVKMRGRRESMLTDTGTFCYKAPEMFVGAGYSEAVDNWAVGILLYEMITGRTPFSSEYLSDTKDSIMNADADFSHAAFYKYNPLVKDLIRHLLKKKPSERITCEEAKKHLWFFSHLSEDDIMRSAEIKGKMMDKKDIVELTSLLIKNESMGNKNSDNKQIAISMAERQLMKTWLETINEDVHSVRTSDLAIDFFESEDEEEEVTPDSPKFKKAKGQSTILQNSESGDLSHYPTRTFSFD